MLFSCICQLFLLPLQRFSKNNKLCMMVLIGAGKYAYRRPDGVYVVPIGCLKP